MSTYLPKLITNPARVRAKLANPKLRSHLSQPIIIKGKNVEFFHRLNQTYNRRNPLKLISAAWHKRTKTGDFFSILPFKPNLAASVKDMKFEDLNLDSEIVESLRACELVFPTEIQKKVYSAIISRNNHVAVFASTGSGKTLAYLLPIMQYFLRTKSSSNQIARPRHPRCILLVPTNELCNQVYETCRMFEGVMSSLHLTSKMTELEIENLKTQTYDLVIASPISVLFALRRGLISLSSCEHVVVDEADTLLDDSFSPVLSQIFAKLVFTDGINLSCQLVFCGATLPERLDSFVESFTAEASNLQLIQGSSVENLQSHVKHDFFKVAPTKVNTMLRDMLSDLTRKPGAILIFCNSKSSVRKLSYFLQNEGIHHETVDSDVDKMTRQNMMSLLRDGFIKVLLSTDVISRGFDTTVVHYVINYDCPNHLSDYIHRAGRVGRLGQASSGRVITFACRPYHADVIREIESSVRLHRPLLGVNANIKQRFAEATEAKQAKAYAAMLKEEHSADMRLTGKIK